MLSPITWAFNLSSNQGSVNLIKPQPIEKSDTNLMILIKYYASHMYPPDRFNPQSSSCLKWHMSADGFTDLITCQIHDIHRPRQYNGVM